MRKQEPLRMTGEDRRIFDAVMTVPEAAITFGISEFAVRDAIKRGAIVAAQKGGTWLIRTDRAVERWGAHLHEDLHPYEPAT